MSQITAILVQKKNPNRFNIFLDGRFAFAISDYELLKKSLKIGQNLNELEINQIAKKEEISRLTDLTLRFLNYRLRSEKEIAEYLAKKISARQHLRYSQAKESLLIPKVVDKLKKYQLINDLEFARWFTASRIKSKPQGLRKTVWELKRKGVDPEAIEKSLTNAPSEKDLAISALEKKLTKWQKLTPLDFKKKVYQFLGSRGFDYEATKTAFEILVKKR